MREIGRLRQTIAAHVRQGLLVICTTAGSGVEGGEIDCSESAHVCTYKHKDHVCKVWLMCLSESCIYLVVS